MSNASCLLTWWSRIVESPWRKHANYFSSIMRMAKSSGKSTKVLGASTTLEFSRKKKWPRKFYRSLTVRARSCNETGTASWCRRNRWGVNLSKSGWSRRSKTSLAWISTIMILMRKKRQKKKMLCINFSSANKAYVLQIKTYLRQYPTLCLYRGLLVMNTSWSISCFTHLTKKQEA